MSASNDYIDLNVLLHMLEQYPDRLSSELLTQLDTLSQALSQQDVQAARTLVDLITQSPELDALYEQSLKDIRNGYSRQERAKSIPLTIQLPFPDGGTATLHELATAIQTTIAQRQAIALSARQAALLKTLEKQRLRPQDLAHTLGQPLHHLQPILQDLWQQGYIDDVAASPIYTLFPALRSSRYRHRPVPDTMFLTLTAKGYFPLYPMRKQPHPAGARTR